MPLQLVIPLIAYSFATTLHFFHNALYLNSYPNMPDWISQLEVYGSLAFILSIGVLGCLLFIRKRQVTGLILIGLYGSFGFDGLGHYFLAPISAHTITMNFTIWFEVITGALLVLTTLWLLRWLPQST